MKTSALYLLAILLSEFGWSYLVDMMNVSVVARKRLRAVIYSVVSMTISYGVLKVIAQHNWDNLMIATSIVGVAAGTYLAAARKPKKKRKTMKKIPVTTA